MTASELVYFHNAHLAHVVAYEEHQRGQRLSAKRQAFIEHYRTMKAQRRFARDNAARIEAEWNALPTPPLTIAQHVEHARLLRNDILKGDAGQA